MISFNKLLNENKTIGIQKMKSQKSAVKKEEEKH